MCAPQKYSVGTQIVILCIAFNIYGAQQIICCAHHIIKCAHTHNYNVYSINVYRVRNKQYTVHTNNQMIKYAHPNCNVHNI
jgi:hypothetical protein